MILTAQEKALSYTVLLLGKKFNSLTLFYECIVFLSYRKVGKKNENKYFNYHKSIMQFILHEIFIVNKWKNQTSFDIKDLMSLRKAIFYLKNNNIIDKKLKIPSKNTLVNLEYINEDGSIPQNILEQLHIYPIYEYYKDKPFIFTNTITPTEKKLEYYPKLNLGKIVMISEFNPFVKIKRNYDINFICSKILQNNNLYVPEGNLYEFCLNFWNIDQLEKLIKDTKELLD